MMSLLVLLICFLSLHLQSILTVSVKFTSLSAFSITQICTSGGYRDVCCVPLDLDLKDGHGYGWFIASVISFTEIESPETVTVVYGSTAHLAPCTAGILKRRQGNQAWQTEIDIRQSRGAGSASAVSSFGPVFLRRRVPYLVVVDDVVYRYIGTGASEVMSFRNQQGDVIHGKLPDNARTSAMHNLTGPGYSRAEGPTDRSTS